MAYNNTILTAAIWVQQALLGNVATMIAILAIAAVGAGMLTGRIEIRRSVCIVLGVFVLFGAPAIASGLRTMLDQGTTGSVVVEQAVPLPEQPSQPSINPFDPYYAQQPPKRQ